ncbi:MAG: Uncharacterized protein FD138_89 [Planctomycetota bacterium]|nr:MAG: Uncharacterized protein FD138_89 [Planctomycetota bacterium]
MKKPPSSSMSRRDLCRRLLGLATATPLAMSWLGTPQLAVGDWSNGNTTRVEEDWSVKIGTPDPDYDSPQITSVIAPSWSLSGKYAVFDMNCATQPGFSSGGVQIQLWQDDAIIQTASNTNWASMHIVDEEIRYTTAMSIENGNLVFEILNGSSESWGTFGSGELKLQLPTWRDHLNWYDPNFTTSNSRIGFASHRVRRFILERVRYFSADGLQSTDETPRVLHQYDPQA